VLGARALSSDATPLLLLLLLLLLRAHLHDSFGDRHRAAAPVALGAGLGDVLMHAELPAACADALERLVEGRGGELVLGCQGWPSLVNEQAAEEDWQVGERGEEESPRCAWPRSEFE